MRLGTFPARVKQRGHTRKRAREAGLARDLLPRCRSRASSRGSLVVLALGLVGRGLLDDDDHLDLLLLVALILGIDVLVLFLVDVLVEILVLFLGLGRVLLLVGGGTGLLDRDEDDAGFLAGFQLLQGGFS